MNVTICSTLTTSGHYVSVSSTKVVISTICHGSGKNMTWIFFVLRASLCDLVPHFSPTLFKEQRMFRKFIEQKYGHNADPWIIK